MGHPCNDDVTCQRNGGIHLEADTDEEQAGFGADCEKENGRIGTCMLRKVDKNYLEK